MPHPYLPDTDDPNILYDMGGRFSAVDFSPIPDDDNGHREGPYVEDGVLYGVAPYPLERPTPTLPKPFSPIAVRLADVATEDLAWVWPGWIPAGVLTILGGHVGDGKSTAMAALVAALTSGAPLPDGATVPAMNVLILGVEDDPARVLRPRLIANGADANRIFLLEPDTRLRPDLRKDCDWLRDIIRENDIGLVVIDPLGSILRRSDRASEGDIRAELEPLMQVIDATGVAVVGVMRVGKGGSVRRPAQSLVGSSAFPAIARSVIMIARDRSADAMPGSRVLEVVKGNYVDPPKPICLTMDASGAVHWHGPLTTTIDELAAMGDDPRLSRSEREEAVTFLTEMLAGGPVSAKIVMEKALKAGFSEITIRRAKKDANIGSYRVTRSKGLWRWCLPGDEDKVQEFDHLNHNHWAELSLEELGAVMRRGRDIYEQWQAETAEREAAGLPTRSWEDYRASLPDEDDGDMPEPDPAS